MKKKQVNRLKNNIILLLIATLLVTLCSCKGNMTEQTVKAELERLLPLSYELNEIFWGEGLPLQKIDSTDRFLPVENNCGYSSTEDIIKKAEEIFSEEYLEIIKDAIFTDSDDTDPRYADINGILKADSMNKGFDVKGNIVVDSVKIMKQNKGMVIFSADYEDGGQTEITLINQNGKWYLNSPTY